MMRPRSPFSPDDTTRYLCVAARADERFAERMIREVLGDDLHAVAPSIGYSLLPVLLHGLAGRRQRRVRDWGLLAATLAALIVSPLWTVLAVLVILPVGGNMARRAAESRRLRDAVLALLTLLLMLILSVSFVSGIGVAAAEPDPRGPPAEGSQFGWLIGLPWAALLIALAMYALMVWNEGRIRATLLRGLTRDVFRPDAAPALPASQEWISERLAEIDQAQGGNVTIYDGFTPFIGYGPTVSTWSFALPTLRREADPPSDGQNVVLLDTVELIGYVRDRLASIGTEPYELPGLLLSERVFVSGNALTAHETLLPERESAPHQSLPAEDLARLAERPHGTARHYLCAHVPSWGGEVIASTFLHFSTDGRLLYLQCDRTILAPLWEQYHDVDRLTPQLTMGTLGRMAARAVSGLPGALGRAPLRVVRDLNFRWRWERRRTGERAIARQDLGYNYGARVSIREEGADTNYHNYFQKTDADKHLKLVERHVLAALLDFLDEHEVDTAEFRTRQMTILNQGIIQTGGVSNVENQAVGSDATVAVRVAGETRAPAAGQPARQKG
jgi:hypothetical protein